MYNFKTITVDYVPRRVKKEPVYKPISWSVAGSFFGLWVAAITLLNTSYADVAIWFGSVLYALTGASFGYTCYRYFYNRNLQKFLYTQGNESLRFSLSLPVDWVLPAAYALTYIEAGVDENVYQITDPYGQVWDIFDRFQSTDDLTLFLRQPVNS